MKTIDDRLEKRNFIFDMVKGFFMGSGFIVPGVSGGAISAIFGVYKPLITWLSNIKKDFKKNLKYFFPIGIGGIIGIIFFSFLIFILIGSYETIMMWSFVGAILGMVPSLWKETGKEGRDGVDIIYMVLSFIFAFSLMFFGNTLFKGRVEPSFFIWIICGFLISLGLLIPGLSPSNFILYMGLYDKMAEGFAKVDFSVIIPIVIGSIITIFSLAKVIEKIFKNHYSKFYHLIFGVVIASTLMIIPTNYIGFKTIDYILSVVSLIAGILLGSFMAKLEEKYK